jgi:hypothetical protein
MANVNYIINSELFIPRVVMELESESGNEIAYVEIEHIEQFYKILSRATLEEYLTSLDNKMIEYASNIVYDNSSRDTISQIYVLANIRDNLRVYLYPPEQQQGELDG